MASITHTVGGESNLVSFKSAARVPIESLKVHFSPIQEGEGDPSPENIRPISGWDGIEQFYSGKNMGHIVGYSAGSAYNNNYITSGGYGNTISTINPENSITITQTQWPNTSNIKSYQNGYFCIVFDNLHLNEYYDFSCKITNITNNPLGALLSNFHIAGPAAAHLISPAIVKDDTIIFKNLIFEQDSRYPNYQAINFYYCGMSFTISDIMVTPANTNDGVFEPYTQKRLVNWNQWLKPLTAENWQAYNSNNIDVTFEDGIATSTWLTNNSGYSASVRTKIGILQKSKEIWYVSYMVKSSISNLSWGAEYNGGLQETAISAMEADNWHQCSLSNIYWRGTRNYIYLSYMRSSTEHIGLIAQIKSPIFINLTQMFGQGNEPTKEEFEEQCVLNGIDLTSALPYDEGSVREWKTSGKLLKNSITFPVLGKNKFNINASFSEPSNTALTGSRIFQPYTYCLGLTTGNTYSPDKITDCSITNNTLTFTTTNTSYGVFFTIPSLYGTYRLSYTGENVSPTFLRYDSEGKLSYSGSSLDSQGIIAIGPDVSITGVLFKSTTANTPTTISNIQIEEGITATEYEEFNPNHTVYGGYVDLAKGELVSTYLHCKIKDLPGEWNYRASNNRFQITLSNYFANAPSSGGIWTNFAISEIYKTSTSNGYGNKQIATYINKHIYIRDDDFEGDVDTFLNSVGDTYITYELAEPIHYSLTPNQLTTFLNQNNFWSNTNGPTEVSYAIHDSEQIQSARKRILAAAPKIEEASGSIATFNTDISAPLKECKVYFKPIQEGSDDPSPENIRAISGWTGVEVYREEDNLFDKSLSMDGYRLSLSGANYVAAGYYISAYIPVSEGQVLIKNSPIADAYHRFCTYSSKGAAGFIRHVENNTITIAAGENFIRICGEVTEKDATTLYVDNSTTFPITFPSEAGTIYGGYVDLVKGELVEIYHKIILDGVTTNCKCNSDYSDNNYIIGGVVYLEPKGLDDYQSGNSRLFCNTMPLITPSNTAVNLPYIRTISAGQQYLRIYLANTIDHPELDTKQKRIDFVNVYLQENPITIIYPLREPIYYSLTPETLKTLRNTNNIWSNANGDIQVKYWTH